MTCTWDNPTGCPGSLLGKSVAAAVPPAWDEICKSFVTGASNLLQAFARAFAAIPDVDPADAGISNAYAASLAIAAVVAVLLMFGQVIRTAWTHDGAGLAQGVSGLAKTVLTWLATAAVASAALAASDEATDWIVRETFGSQQSFIVHLGNIVNWAIVTGKPGQAIVGASIALVIALIGIVLLVVLWFEMLLRNTALAVLLAVSPISAAGQMSETTKVWWQRLVSACIQLIILKPVVALVFAVGFFMAGKSRGLEAVLAGLLALGLAVFAWPVIARFFTFATVQSSASGLATALGFAAGRLSGGGGGNGGTAGVNPGQWSLGAERQTMAARGGAPGGEGLAGAGAGGAPGGTPGGPGGGSGAAGGGNGGAVAAGIGWALQTAHNVGSTLAGRMEQTAGHAGMHGAYPYSTVGGGQRISRRSQGTQTVPGHTGSTHGGTAGGDQAPDTSVPREDSAPEQPRPRDTQAGPPPQAGTGPAANPVPDARTGAPDAASSGSGDDTTDGGQS